MIGAGVWRQSSRPIPISQIAVMKRPCRRSPRFGDQRYADKPRMIWLRIPAATRGSRARRAMRSDCATLLLVEH